MPYEAQLSESFCLPKWDQAKGIDFELTRFGCAPATRQGTSESVIGLNMSLTLFNAAQSLTGLEMNS